jgi:NADH:ubiquinone oxidoreductase subunit 5 (subunit L)/multisubunit Na+/H+ antiporter MnhA subunit
MNCPSCGNQAISFFEWSRGANAFSTQCRSCGAKLKANRATWVGFLLAVLAVVASVPFTAYLFKTLAIIDTASRSARALAITPVVIVGAVIVWFVGGYEVAKK